MNAANERTYRATIRRFQLVWIVAGMLWITLSVVVASADGADGWICPPCGCDSDGKTFESGGTCSDCGMELVLRESLLNVAIVVFEGVELLDFAGPGEVFAAAHGFLPFTVAITTEPILSQGFVRVTPEYSIEETPEIDIVVVPGGGVGALLESETLMAWLKTTAAKAEHVVSVCNGAIVLADAGLLDGIEATTHWGAIEGLKQRAPKTRVLENTRFVDAGKFLTTAGVSAGIDGALHLVSKVDGAEEAARVARYMEYDYWAPRETPQESR